MGNETTISVTLPNDILEKLESMAQKHGCSLQQLICEITDNYVVEANSPELELFLQQNNTLTAKKSALMRYQPFSTFMAGIHHQAGLRKQITLSYYRSEQDAIAELLHQLFSLSELSPAIQQFASHLTTQLRQQLTRHAQTGLVQLLLQQYPLSSTEGTALMCLAEALLRIPDTLTQDSLIQDKLLQGNWISSSKGPSSLRVKAVVQGLRLTRWFISKITNNQSSLVKRRYMQQGNLLIRQCVKAAIRLLGRQFVIAETITLALKRAQQYEKQGFRHSYDMLGEAALTVEDAERYFQAYQSAIHAIGHSSTQGIYEGPGISIKLSALHPRYHRSQYQRVMAELYPRLLNLALLAKQYNIGLNIDAEEVSRLDISLDLLEKLCAETQLANWDGIGFVVQAYQKRALAVIKFLIGLAQRSRHRLMVRLVKGAYWDSEIKRAQIDGQEGYPVYTRKVYTDISYLACAQKLLANTDFVYPQFATHNTQTVAAIYQMAGSNYFPGQYEFQCLYGMGESLYQQFIGENSGTLTRPCRIYAPVGTHQTLLAYLVRRLLENGANSSFVNHLADQRLSIAELVADPVQLAVKLAEQEGELGLPHPQLPLPRALYRDIRSNSHGLDFNNENHLLSLANALTQYADSSFYALPLLAGREKTFTIIDKSTISYCITNPANNDDTVGYVQEVTTDEIEYALNRAEQGAKLWSNVSIEQRAIYLERVADLMASRTPLLLTLLVREAGKTLANAVAEIREAIDFLRYYSCQIKHHFANHSHFPLGTVICISPWNFPLAIFTGQISAALAAGNSVIAKPAEQAPLIAAQAIHLFLEAGIPDHALQFLPGSGEHAGEKLTTDDRIRGVMFTGSTEVAKKLQQNLAGLIIKTGLLPPLIAETGGINAMVIDASALTEQVVNDVIASAFDSAGQRCSALRLLCIPEEVADSTISMLQGAIRQYCIGDPADLSTDIGPLIDKSAYDTINHYITQQYQRGKKVYQAGLTLSTAQKKSQNGFFIAPTLIELSQVEELQQEVFGPVLHVVRYQVKKLPQLLESINAAGYGLTFAVHSRINTVIEMSVRHIKAGNIYVNRNMVGAVVGVQPFGGEGLSGTGPKAGGPLYLYRLLQQYPMEAVSKAVSYGNTKVSPLLSDTESSPALLQLQKWAQLHQLTELEHYCHLLQKNSIAGTEWFLPGPTGEQNRYALLPKARVLSIADTEINLLLQSAAILAAGGKVFWLNSELACSVFSKLSSDLQSIIMVIEKMEKIPSLNFDTVLYQGTAEQLTTLCYPFIQHTEKIVAIQYLKDQRVAYLPGLLQERLISINETAVGGNTQLMNLC